VRIVHSAPGVPVADYCNPYCDANSAIDSQPICQTCPSAGDGGTDVPSSGNGADMPPADGGSDVQTADGGADVQTGDAAADVPPADGGQGADGTAGEPAAPAIETASAYDLALAAFHKGDNATALKQINLAAKEEPNSGDVHQLRSMIHFARKEYRASAAAAHKALTGDTPWEWADVKSSYLSTAAYTADLRALEAHVARKPADTAALFALAYQYVVLDHKDAARATLKKVVALEPRDKLAGQLMASLSQTKG
jgi:hypothetical protein